MEGLFRKEALEATRSEWLGEISLAQPMRFWVLTALAVAAALIIALILTFGTYTRRSSVTGQLVPSKGLTITPAPATGVVASLVDEGEGVAEGDLLAVIRVPLSSLAGGDTVQATERQLSIRRTSLSESKRARDQLLRTQELGLQQQLEAARQELSQIDLEIGTRKSQIRISEETLARLQQLEAERYVSLMQIKQQESDVLFWRGELQNLERQAISARRTVSELQQALSELPSESVSVDSNYQQEVARLAQEELENHKRGTSTARASISGVVAARLVKPGQHVEAGQALLSMLPSDDHLEAELLVPTRAIGFIKTGDRVLLRYRAFPYQKFGHHEATIKRISRSAHIPEDAQSYNSAGRAEPSYRITVVPEKQSVTAFGEELPLRPGMLVEADILGEKRRLMEWLLEPLFAINGRVRDT